MLVLSRKEGERIVIGDNITLVISKVSGNRVTIGIEAPRDVKVVRGELDDAAVEALRAAIDGRGGPCEVATRSVVQPKASLRDFAKSVLPLNRRVG